MCTRPLEVGALEVGELLIFCDACGYREQLEDNLDADTLAAYQDQHDLAGGATGWQITR